MPTRIPSCAIKSRERLPKTASPSLEGLISIKKTTRLPLRYIRKLRDPADLACQNQKLKIMDTLRILCVHGVGHGDLDPQLQPTWTNALTGGIQRWNPEQQIECDFIFYDDLFGLETRCCSPCLNRQSLGNVDRCVHIRQELSGRRDEGRCIASIFQGLRKRSIRLLDFGYGALQLSGRLPEKEI